MKSALTTAAMRVDGFAVTPATNLPLAPMVERSDNAAAGNGALLFGSLGMVSGVASGDINNDGKTELVLVPTRLLIWGSVVLFTLVTAATVVTETRFCGRTTSVARPVDRADRLTGAG